MNSNGLPMSNRPEVTINGIRHVGLVDEERPIEYLSPPQMAFTDDELAVYESMGKWVGAFLALPVLHPNERQEAVAAIHDLQRMVECRPAYRWARERKWAEVPE